ncbi:MAG: hypothetical protein PWQ97_1757 [Tepidanaerobacteraceae bacterium]|nr:hypothetical protein [Tepidanaerobacteraceae bacterium]
MNFFWAIQAGRIAFFFFDYYLRLAGNQTFFKSRSSLYFFIYIFPVSSRSGYPQHIADGNVYFQYGFDGFLDLLGNVTISLEISFLINKRTIHLLSSVF